MNQPKLGVFDIDGTIRVNSVIPESVLAGMNHIHELGFLTTVSTGRGYVRAKDILGEDFNTIISPDALMIVEHGTKIVDQTGHIVQADYLKENELDHIIDFSQSNKDMVRLLWFIPSCLNGRMQIWCKYPEDVEKETGLRDTYADVFHCSFTELRARFNAHPLSSVSVKLEPFVSVQNLKLHFTRSEIDIIFQDDMMEYLRNIADKSKAVLYLEKHHGISVENMLVAGNAINDVDMLNLPAGRRVLVGTGPATDVVIGHLVRPEEVIRVDTPEDLGLYLQSITE